MQDLEYTISTKGFKSLLFAYAWVVDANPVAQDFGSNFPRYTMQSSLFRWNPRKVKKAAENANQNLSWRTTWHVNLWGQFFLEGFHKQTIIWVDFMVVRYCVKIPFFKSL